MSGRGSTGGSLEPSTDHPYSQLMPDVVLSAAESLGYVPDARIYPLNSYENRVYQVGLEDGGHIVLKFYRPERWSDAQILEEHAFSRELDELEIPVVPALEFKGHGSLLEFAGFRFAVFPHLRGRAPELDNLDHLLVMGRFIGRLHAVGALRPFRHRPALSIARFGEASREYLLQHDFLPADLRPAYETLTRDLLLRLTECFAARGPWTQIRLHGDCHPGNVLWRDDTPWFVDFDDTLTGPAIQDLWMLLSGDRNQRQAQLLEVVEGYNEFHDFRGHELGLVEALRTLRLMHYSAWLARRWKDPAFPLSFPWFNSERYWAEHILELREQLAALDEPPLELMI